MNSERNIVKKLFENKGKDDIQLDEKTYTVGDTQYWRRGGQTYKWTASAGRSECSEDEYNKAVDACRNGGSTSADSKPASENPPDSTDNKSERLTHSRKIDMATDKNTSPDILHQLATLTPRPKNGFKSQSAHDDFLRSSERQTQLRSLVAGNPSAPPDLLKSFLNSDRPSVWATALSNPNMPEEELRYYADRGREEALVAIAKNPSIPQDVIEKLSQSDNDKVKKFIYDNPSTPDDIRKKLEGSISDNSEFRLERLKKAWYRGSERLDDKTLSTYADDKNPKVREYVADIDYTPPEVLLKLSHDKNIDVLDNVLKHPNSPDSAINNIIAQAGDFKYDDHDKDRMKLVGRIAGCKRTPVDTMKQLSAHEDGYIRNKVADNENCPGDILRKLARDEKSFVVISVARNKNTPSDVLKYLIDDNQNSSIVCAALSNPSTPVELLRDASDSTFSRERESVAENEACPEELLRKLAKDPEIEVRRAAKQNLKDRRERGDN